MYGPSYDFSWARGLRERRRAAGSPTVTGLVHTFNEQEALPDALESLGWVDELVVVDMHSTDDTVQIAEAAGARVVFFEHVGYVEPARNFGLAQANCDWILVLDADERVVEPLALELCAIAEQDRADVVDISWRNWLCGRFLDATGWGEETHPRFFKRGHVSWPDAVHGQPEYRGRYERMARREGVWVEHLNFRNLEHLVTKTNRYTNLEVEKLGPTGPDGWQAAVAAAREELAHRWQPQVDGTQSAALATVMLFYRLLSHAKRWERDGWPEVGAPESPESALRDLASPAGRLHREGLEAYERGDRELAFARLREALAAAVDPELLNDLAVVAASLGDRPLARALLLTALATAPDHDGAAANLRLVDHAA